MSEPRECWFPDCVDGDRPEWCGNCGDLPVRQPTTEPASDPSWHTTWECAHGHRWQMRCVDPPRRCPVCGTITFSLARAEAGT